MFQRIDHVAFVVKNRQKSIEFYEKNFGFKKYFEHDVPREEIEKIVYLQLGSTVLELVHKPQGESNSGYHFCLITDNFEKDFQKLKEQAVEVAQAPHPADPRAENEKGWQRAVFKGLDGEMIEIRG